MQPNEALSLLTTVEAAKFLRLSPRSLERYRIQGTGPKYMKAGPGPSRARPVRAAGPIKLDPAKIRIYLRIQKLKFREQNINLLSHFHVGNRYLTREEIKWRVNLSATQIDRLEKIGDFPARATLIGRRVGWLETEITSWMQQKVDSRLGAERIVIRPNDRFVGEAETCRYTSLSRQTLNRYEGSDAFPSAVRICEGRKVWVEREVGSWRGHG